VHAKQSNGGLVGQAIAGTYVVVMGWDLTDESLKRGLLGFAIQRSDKTEGETYWLRGMKTFPDATPLPPGGNASSHDQPYQSFQWADYSAKPDHDYSYNIIAMYGEPGSLKDGPSIILNVRTENEWAEASQAHSVFFNRAAIASQEYARRFENKQPGEVGEAAYTWLSRGLVEAMLAFIGRAADASFGLYVAIYEFRLPALLNALRDSSDRGCAVAVLFDDIENRDDYPARDNKEQIAAAKIVRLCKGIANGKIMHNKFMILTKNNRPIAVWTGSTNFSESAVYGQLNCGHAVDDPRVAQHYLDYWNQLSNDPEIPQLREWDDDKNPAPTSPPAEGVTVIFSPQKGLSTLEAYADIAASATAGMFMSFAFGMNKAFLRVYQTEDSVLRFALMDKEGTGSSAASGRQHVAELRRQSNVVVAVGKNIVTNAFDRWMEELPGMKVSKHVKWVHTKFMLVDPLSDDPIVITGSANFSDPSTRTNHENMLLIRGDRRVADIYFGEFMRQFSTYAFRDATAEATRRGGDPADWRPQNLVPDDTWVKEYFRPNTSRSLRRLYFSGGNRLG
jgi:phosphatidylserine/phosphatidylglycerophosphate/cardiolipin synthase-like enzyme